MKESRVIGRLWRLAMPCILLLAVGWAVDPARIAAHLLRAEPAWLIAGLVVVQAQVVGSALRWRYTVARLGRRLTVPHVLREYYLASLLNQVLPGGVTGDAARIARNRHAGGVGAVAYGVIIERLAGQVALVAVTLVGLLAWPWIAGGGLPDEATAGIRALAVLFAGSALAALLLMRFGPAAWRPWLGGFGPAVRRAWWADGAWLVQGVSSVVIVGTYLLVFAIAAYAIDQPLPWPAVPIVVPLVLFTMLLPISVGGWGVREVAAAALWPVVGLTAEAGVATSVLYGLLSLVGALPGAAVPAGDRGAPT